MVRYQGWFFKILFYTDAYIRGDIVILWAKRTESWWTTMFKQTRALLQDSKVKIKEVSHQTRRGENKTQI